MAWPLHLTAAPGQLCADDRLRGSCPGRTSCRAGAVVLGVDRFGEDGDDVLVFEAGEGRASAVVGPGDLERDPPAERDLAGEEDRGEGAGRALRAVQIADLCPGRGWAPGELRGSSRRVGGSAAGASVPLSGARGEVATVYWGDGVRPRWAAAAAAQVHRPSCREPRPQRTGQGNVLLTVSHSGPFRNPKLQSEIRTLPRSDFGVWMAVEAAPAGRRVRIRVADVAEALLALEPGCRWRRCRPL